MIGLAEGKTVQDPEVQKSALNVIINCVWGPMERVSIFFYLHVKYGSVFP